MSDYAYRLNLQPFFANPPRAERFEALAIFISRRLYAMARALGEKDLVFEAGDAEDLAQRFNDFANSEDTSCFAFSQLWEELEQWGETTVQWGRREKSLCNIDRLPVEFSC